MPSSPSACTTRKSMTTILLAHTTHDVLVSSSLLEARGGEELLAGMKALNTLFLSSMALSSVVLTTKIG